MFEKQRESSVKRVLQVGGLAGPEGAAGGVWSVASMQTEALRNIGLDVTLLGTWLGPIPEQDGQPKDIIMRVRKPFPGSRLRGLYSFSYLTRVKQEARKIDLAHIHFCRDFTTTLSLITIARNGIPIVVQTHGMFTKPKNWLVRAYDTVITRRLVQIPKIWLTLTEQEEENLKALGVSTKRIERVVNASTDPDLKWSDPSDITCVFIARLAERKQPKVFVEAALRLLEEGKDAMFVLAGTDQGEEQGLRRLIQDSDYAHRFQLLGHVAHEKVSKLLANATVFVLPALDEPYPMAVIEAASVGTPIILTRECGLAAEIDKAEAGILIDPEIESTLAAMRTVLGSPNLRRTMSRNARELHRHLWSVESLAESLREKYERSADGN